MNQRIFDEFLASDDTLRVYEGDRLIFASKKERLAPLLDYIDGLAAQYHDVVAMDRIMGNAAALLAVKAGCREVYSPLGSEAAVATLDKYGVRHHLTRLVPCIQQDGSTEICPMEKLSLGKTPEEFYAALKAKSGGKVTKEAGMIVSRQSVKATQPLPGVKRRLLARSPTLMLVEHALEKGTVLPEHRHPHEQLIFLLSGQIMFEMAAASHKMVKGDSVVIPPDVPHKVTALETSVVMDVFTPAREDFL